MSVRHRDSPRLFCWLSTPPLLAPYHHSSIWDLLRHPPWWAHCSGLWLIQDRVCGPVSQGYKWRVYGALWENVPSQKEGKTPWNGSPLFLLWIWLYENKIPARLQLFCHQAEDETNPQEMTEPRTPKRWDSSHCLIYLHIFKFPIRALCT